MVDQNPATHARARDLIQPRELPMLFSDRMVRAILDGSKTQTRRVVRLRAKEHALTLCRVPPTLSRAPCQRGDQLWVRETWGLLNTEPCDGPAHAHVFFRATDGEKRDLRYQRWRPSIHMPRWASRITLVVTDVRAEPLREITAHDALCEGVSGPCILDNFERLWDSINAERAGCSWSDNPWVWAISFRRLEP